MTGKVVLRFALTVVGVLLLGGCAGEVDIASIEDEVASGIEDQSGIAVTVDCPDQVDWEVGGEFHCVAESLSGSDRAMVTVSMENDEGDITWSTG